MQAARHDDDDESDILGMWLEKQKNMLSIVIQLVPLTYLIKLTLRQRKLGSERIQNELTNSPN